MMKSRNVHDPCEERESSPILLAHKLRRFFQNRKRQNGQGLSEYAIIILLVALAAVIVVALFGSAVKGLYCDTIIKAFPEYALSCVEDPKTSSSDEQEFAITAVAAYRSFNGIIIIAAKSLYGSTGQLSVEGYGPMDWNSEYNGYILRTQTDHPPSTVTIVSSNGDSITIDVMIR